MLAERALVSRTFWEMRALTTAGQVLLILFGGKIMVDITEMIMWTPAEFGPMLIVMGAVLGLLGAFVKGFLNFSEADKEAARKTGVRLTYGLNYVAEHISVAIITAIATLIVPGVYFDMTGNTGTFTGYMLIGFATAVIFAWGGDSLCTKVLESFRNRAKADAAASGSETTRKVE